MTMLIAGHETTAAVLTWTFFCIVQNPQIEAKVPRERIDPILVAHTAEMNPYSGDIEDILNCWT